MRFLRRSLVGLFLAGLTLGLLALAGQGVMTALQERWSEAPPERPARERVFAVNVIPVVGTDIRPVMTAFGEIRSRRTLDLRAAVGGPVVELAADFEEGGSVAAGQLLLRIDPADAQSALDVARTDLSEAEAELRDAVRALALARDELRAAADQARLRDQALARQRDLLGRGVGTEAAVETAELAASAAEQAVLAKRQAIAQAEARVDQARNAVARREIGQAEAERRLADTELRAEFAGTLSDVAVVEGGLVAANERVARLIDPRALEVSFRVSTSQYARLLDDTGRLRPVPVRVKLDNFGIDLVAHGQVSRAGAAVGEGQTGRLIFATLDGKTAIGFRPGDFVAVEIEEPELPNVAVLPATAVDAAGTVLVLGEDDRLLERRVEILRKQRNDVIVRAPDLHGAEVVAERTPLIGAGIRVRPVRAGDRADMAEPPDMLELTPERRARLLSFVEGNGAMPEDVKDRLRAQLQETRVPARVVERLEARIGG
ncbi:efflux RND transporter periplasmic adaptor subunit [Rhodovulum sp. YNF3179]|uniref:efflux RND transporter periplasmic adaptor subunit n=1 Tax=Rhodovulum sp. YNF3179 TaxID=3425127 RepID=UPI003D3255AB